MRILNELDKLTRGKRFIYCSENQNSYDELNSLRFQLEFDALHIYKEVNTVCLVRGGNEARFNNVMSIDYIESTNILGSIIVITCRNLLVKNENKTHIIIAE